MDLQNYSLVSEFVLHGLCTSQHLQKFFFVFFSEIYVVTVLGNLIIVVTVISDPHLHSSPMYFLLGNLSFLDICLASFATPKMIRDFLSDQKLISFGGCMAQIFFLHFVGGAEMVLLVTMAYDRFSVDKLLSVFYTIFTPLLNPLIYTLRNKEMKISMKKLRNRHVTFH
ncbi:unnamed protein product [Rangifer tarandus platyrhynchus]|uniref:Uncharacterized protein n=1 Tax=Rangifer tarandus platyrhynchus TaxID=3082113 RepID=A0AC60A0T6_RANTA